MKRRLLLLNARRGLGNRLRAVLCALAYKDATGCALRVLWAPNAQCGAAIDDLWVHPLRAISLRQARWMALFSGGWKEHLDAEDLDLGRFRRPVLALQCSQPFSNPGNVAWPDELRRFTPVPDIRRRIEALWKTLAPDVPLVGVMVRAHASAHRRTLESQPVEYALGRIESLRARYPDAVVYLSSDSPEASEVIGQRHRVVELDAKGEFNTVRGVQDAVCDLYVLASCQWIVGSHASSFSEIAGLVAGHGGYETARDAPRVALGDRLRAPRRSPADFWNASSAESHQR